MKSALALIPLLFAAWTSVPAFAADLPFENNTATAIEHQTYPPHGIVHFAEASYYRHLSGYFLQAKIVVKNLAYMKRIHLHKVDHAGHITETVPMDLHYIAPDTFAKDAPFIYYAGSVPGPVQFDQFVVAIDAKPYAYERYVVQVEMNGESYWSGYVTMKLPPR